VAKILYCGDVGCQTGFGRVAEYLIPAFAKEHEVHALAVNWGGDPNPMQQVCHMYPAMAYGSDPFGSHRIAELVQRINPDLVWVTNDFWIGINLWNHLQEVREKTAFKFFCYTPIDSYGIYPETLPPVMDWDGIATYTQFGAEELRKAGYDKHVDVVGHGTDFTKFFPLDKQECRKALGVPEDAFIVFNGNRNQPRKRIDLTIKGFIKFALDKPDARLWLHMGQKDMGWDIVPLFKRVSREMGYESTGKLILTNPSFSTDNCLPIEQLNQVYNSVDVGVNTCIGEGWGLVNTEHAATGVAQLVADHTSLKEIFDEIPRIPIESWEVDRNYGLDRGQPSPDGMAVILNNYYENRKELEQTGAWCLSRMHNERFTWPYISEQMRGIVERLLAEPKEKEFKGFGTPTRID
jgi:D-inositol-3-phosphate glycosyltransferase